MSWSYTVIFGSRLAKLWYRISKRYVAFTVGTFIFVMWEEMDVPPEINRRLIAHEAVHVAQWKRYWYIGFLPVYWYHIARYGYKRNPLELEARAAER